MKRRFELRQVKGMHWLEFSLRAESTGRVRTDHTNQLILVVEGAEARTEMISIVMHAYMASEAQDFARRAGIAFVREKVASQKYADWY